MRRSLLLHLLPSALLLARQPAVARWEEAPLPRCCDCAEAHWRAALLPCRSPLDEELRAALRAL